ncbi:MAG: alpha/beta fold hydrolase, partial [Achromobacter spanius]
MKDSHNSTRNSTSSATHSATRRTLLAGGAALATSAFALGAQASSQLSPRNPQSTQGTRMTSSTFTTQDGTQLYYKDWGDGPVVTFSHGWPLNADAWDGQMHFLAQNGFRVIAHDRRGHGRSAQPSSGNDMDTYADDLAQLIEALDLKSITMVGHSTG